MSEQLFQVGDVVSCPRFCAKGESGIVVEVDAKDPYPIEVKFRGGCEWYTADGRFDKDLPPTLQHGPMNWTPNQVRPTPPFPGKGTPIWVSRDKSIWFMRVGFSNNCGFTSPYRAAAIKTPSGYSDIESYRYWLPFDAIKLTDQE